MKTCHHILVTALLGLAISSAAQADNILKNGDFVTATAGAPAEWALYGNKQKISIDTTDIFGAAKQSLLVEITTDAGKGYGQINQKVAVAPNTDYVLKADIKSTAPAIGLTQIKLIVGGAEGSRIEGGRSSTTWSTVDKSFNSGDATQVWIVLRYKQGASEVGQKVWFANVSLTPASETDAPPK